MGACKVTAPRVSCKSQRDGAHRPVLAFGRQTCFSGGVGSDRGVRIMDITEKYLLYIAIGVASIAALMITSAAQVWEFPLPRMVLMQAGVWLLLCALLLLMSSMLQALSNFDQIAKVWLLQKLMRVLAGCIFIIAAVFFVVAYQGFVRMRPCVMADDAAYETSLKFCAKRASEFSKADTDELKQGLGSFPTVYLLGFELPLSGYALPH